MKDLYQTLGVATEASPKEITKAYRTLALKAHPDRGGDAEIMRLLNEAYDTLSDSDKRRAFDANWQAFQQTDVDQEVDIVCAGFLQPGNIRPYSHIFKAEHSSLVRLYEQTPLTKRNKLENPSSFESNLYRSEDQSEPIQYYHDIFSFIRSKKSLKNEPPSLDLPAFSKPLTPAIAIQLFIGFLSGYFQITSLT